MQQPPSHLPAAYWSADVAYNGQATAGLSTVMQPTAFPISRRRGERGEAEVDSSVRIIRTSSSSTPDCTRHSRAVEEAGGGVEVAEAVEAVEEEGRASSIRCGTSRHSSTIPGRAWRTDLHVQYSRLPHSSLRHTAATDSITVATAMARRGRRRKEAAVDAVGQWAAPQAVTAHSSAASSHRLHRPSLVLPPPQHT